MRLPLFLLVLSLPAPAWAADPPAGAASPSASDTRRADAKTRYEQGAAAYAAGRFKDAVDLFLEADSLAPSAPLSFNIARAYEKLGDDSGALRWFRDYLRRAPDAANAKEVQAIVDKLETRLSQKGVQQLTVMSTPSGATVVVDGRPVGVTPWTGDLLPGRHSLELSLRGYEDKAQEVDLAAHRAQDVNIALQAQATPEGTPVAAVAPVAATPTEPPKDQPSETGSKGLGIWPWVTLGAGGAALGGALVFELLRRSSESDAEGDKTQVGYQEKLDEMESRQTTARILAGVGGALVIAGGVLIVIDMGSSGDKKAASLSIAPTPGGAFATASGRF